MKFKSFYSFIINIDPLEQPQIKISLNSSNYPKDNECTGYFNVKVETTFWVSISCNFIVLSRLPVTKYFYYLWNDTEVTVRVCAS